jgi:hypothetical protein
VKLELQVSEEIRLLKLKAAFIAGKQTDLAIETKAKIEEVLESRNFRGRFTKPISAFVTFQTLDGFTNALRDEK